MKNHVGSTANNKSNNKLWPEINKEIWDIMSEDTKILSIKTNLEDVKNTAYSLLDVWLFSFMESVKKF
jgi:hypothetical protein